jgi:hypothetical protein
MVMMLKKKTLKKKTIRRTTQKTSRFVAVVMRKDTNYSNRPYNDWSCFVDTKKEDAVKRALAAARVWGVRYGEYDILVGKLAELVRVPVQFELEKL